MTTYILAQLSIHDPDRYGRYQQAFSETLRPFTGRLLAADTAPEILEGRWGFDKVVLIEFPSPDHAERWARSDAYVAISADRRAATTATVLAVRALST